jgi:hypothetical protein
MRKSSTSVFEYAFGINLFVRDDGQAGFRDPMISGTGDGCPLKSAAL